MEQPAILSATLLERVVHATAAAGGWLPFDRFMAMALYEPGLGYYTNSGVKFGTMPGSGSDFVTAPELSPWFGWAVAQQVAQALETTQTRDVWEFGAGTGALADQVLGALSDPGVCYHIVDVSGTLKARQQDRLTAWGDQVVWHDRWPERLEGVVLGNEVLDAMPVQLLHRDNGVWHERGVVVTNGLGGAATLAWSDRATSLRPPVEVPGDHAYTTEIHPQAEAFMRSLAACWTRGVALLLDYGFPEAEYYHPQRHMGTLVCHRHHRTDADPLTLLGQKDITAHVNFTGIALAAQDAGLAVLGYTSQGRFLINCGLLARVQEAPLADRANSARLVNEHEMGELFKVLALAPAGQDNTWVPLGFAQGDRTHRL